MSTIAEFRIPAEDTTLAEAFEYISDASFELESSVSKTRPSLWVSGAEPEEIESALEEDSSVDSYEPLVEAGDRLLYDVTFADGTRWLYDDLLTEGGSLLAAWGSNGWWQVRIRVQNRDELTRIHDRFVERGINADLRRVSDITDAAGSETRLTPEQQEALEAALERGYFEIPRKISMEELADELDISHQALSERLRRAYETLVDAELETADENERSR
ncbi:helix-turn-helix domain-containing protein [Natrialbaceae archaeon GCM10025810]|uniref:helix-turn-helix domain-containing protein n=1 Tax=Halovalidus salilacus TaxID=3075124 RepID=UPI003605BD9C